MEKVTITKKQTGPIVIEGETTLQWDDGEMLESKPKYSLCGCGYSKKMPICDGSHKEHREQIMEHNTEYRSQTDTEK